MHSLSALYWAKFECIVVCCLTFCLMFHLIIVIIIIIIGCRYTQLVHISSRQIRKCCTRSSCLVMWFGVLAKKIISSWSKTRSLGVDAQLKAGIRYFDMRVSGRPGSSDLFIVHGLYGPTVDGCLDSLATFPTRLYFLISTITMIWIFLWYGHCRTWSAYQSFVWQLT